MRKYLHILSAALLMVYGTIALVIVPIHRHTSENNISTQQLPSAVTSSSGITNVNTSTSECEVCTFSSLSVLVQPSVHSICLAVETDLIQLLPISFHPSDFIGLLSLRGPPNLFS